MTFSSPYRDGQWCARPGPPMINDDVWAFRVGVEVAEVCGPRDLLQAGLDSVWQHRTHSALMTLRACEKVLDTSSTRR